MRVFTHIRPYRTDFEYIGVKLEWAGDTVMTEDGEDVPTLRMSFDGTPVAAMTLEEVRELAKQLLTIAETKEKADSP